MLKHSHPIDTGESMWGVEGLKMAVSSMRRAPSWAWAVVLLAGCLAKGGNQPQTSTDQKPRRAVKIDLAWTSTEVRDKPDAPILTVAMVEDGARGTPVPYFYGYPLYAEGGGDRGLLQMRRDNKGDSSPMKYEDEYGVVHRREELPLIGCAIEGIEETPVKFVPISLTCDLPAPKSLGGKRRPVVGNASTGAKPDEVIAQEEIQKAFDGDWHLKGKGFETGNGTGYFNTDHGQLGFDFERGKLVRLAYHFDPNRVWQNPALWVAQ